MDFTDNLREKSIAYFINMPKTHEYLNGQEAEIIDREFRGWTGWFYKIKGHNEWFQQGCLTNN